jgi:hypothetical protein
MKIIKADLYDQGEWRQVDSAIRKHMSTQMLAAWDRDGYEGIARYAPAEFNFTAMYRDEQSTVTFVFTDEQWTWFTLKWL